MRWGRPGSRRESIHPAMLSVHSIDHREAAVAGQIHALLQQAHAQEAAWLGRHGPSVLPPSVEQIRSGNAFYLGAFDGDRVVGATGLAPDDEPGQIGIALLCVTPTHQRQGIGRSLVAEALRRSGSMVLCVSAAADNAAALSLYRGLGFVAYRHGSLGPDRLAMVKLRRAAGGGE